MKKLFVAIRQGKLEEVQRILEKKPELVNCVAKAPPRSDDRASPLQIAIKRASGVGHTKIISYLLDMGADVNFMEDDKGMRVQEIFCLPALGYMIYAVYVQATPLNFKYAPEETRRKTDEFIAAFARMLELGADPNKIDNRLQPAWRIAINDGLKDHDDADYYAFLTDVTRKLVDLMIAHGANIYRSSGPFPADDPRYTHLYPFIRRLQILTDNLTFNRDLMHGLTPEDEWLTTRPWIPFMRPYYAKDNPYYGAEVSEERKAFFAQLHITAQV